MNRIVFFVLLFVVLSCNRLEEEKIESLSKEEIIRKSDIVNDSIGLKHLKNKAYYNLTKKYSNELILFLDSLLEKKDSIYPDDLRGINLEFDRKLNRFTYRMENIFRNLKNAKVVELRNKVLTPLFTEIDLSSIRTQKDFSMLVGVSIIMKKKNIYDLKRELFLELKSNQTK